MTARILLAGDPHGALAPMIDQALATRPQAVVVLGDLGLDRPWDEAMNPLVQAGIRPLWIPGNHDGDSDLFYTHLFSGQADTLHGKVVTVDGLRIAGLGGVFRGQVWNPAVGDPVFPTRASMLQSTTPTSRLQPWRSTLDPTAGVPRRHRVSVWFEDYQALWGVPADVLVCHEAPSTHPFGFKAIDALAASMGVSRVVHGHHHRDGTAQLACGSLVLSVGIRGVQDLDGYVLRRGDYEPPEPPLRTPWAEPRREHDRGPER